ncbi:MAG: dicarboxylate/amino acid:cation symporter [Marinilabiliales bacterium]|nr:MAG: dicarboxylate/amino acid:cation symporter [Marinilabiliales bacterium]
MWKKWNNLPLWGKIVAGMGAGLVWGMMAVIFDWSQFNEHWIKPFGTIFLNMLRLIAVPLIFVSLVKGMASLTDIGKLSRIGLKTLGFFMASTVVAITVGLLIVNVMKPGHAFPDSRRAEMQEQYAASVGATEAVAEQVRTGGPLDFLVEIVPENIVNAASDNRNILQIIFFAILFGLAVALIPHEKVKAVKDVFDGLNDIVLKIVDLVMKIAPLGVFALLGTLVVEFTGDDIAESLDLFASLGLYIVATVTGYLVIIFIVYPLVIRLTTPVRYKDFYKAISPAQMIAFSTSSSAASLPISMEVVERDLGVSKTISSFVLPIGTTINMDGTSLYQAVGAVFIAQAFGFDLTMAQQLTIVLTATLASIGTPGVPGGGVVMLVIILTSVGLPAEGLAMVLALDRPLDMLRTVVNVTGNCAASTIIAKSENELSYPPVRESDA